MPRGEIVGEDHLGGQSTASTKVFSPWKTMRFVVHDFALLTEEPNEKVKTGTLECLGRSWSLDVYPRGRTDEVDVSEGTSGREDGEECVSIFLVCRRGSANKRDGPIKTRFSIDVPSAQLPDGDMVMVHSFFDEGSKDIFYGYTEFGSRDKILDPANNYLIDGNMTIEIDLQIEVGDLPIWSPPKLIQKASDDLVQLLETAEAETADVHFEVQKKKRGKKTTIHAHRLIIDARAPTLAALLGEGDSSNPCVVPIQNTDPDLFRDVLRFVYGGRIPDEARLKEHGRELVDISNQFGCTGLKHAAEAKLASSAIDDDNCAELILFADAKNCAMLKEVAMTFFVANASQIMQSEDFAKVKESTDMMQELMEAGFGSKKRTASGDTSDESAFKRMRVGALRQNLDEKGLDPDGSREVLISRLEDFDTNNDEDEDEDEDEDDE